jgi:hypothetical protein
MQIRIHLTTFALKNTMTDIGSIISDYLHTNINLQIPVRRWLRHP